MAATVVSASRAITSRPVWSGTTIESYVAAASGGRTGKPYLVGSFAIIAAAISFGT